MLVKISRRVYVPGMVSRDLIEYMAFRCARLGLSVLPYPWGESALRRAARWGGRQSWGRRALVESQLAHTFPDLGPDDLDRLTGCVYDHLGRMAAEILLEDPVSLAATVSVRPGWDGLDRVLSEGRGAIVATGHIGNFELGGRILAGRYPVLDVIKPQRNPYVDRHLERMRTRHGIATVPVDGSGPAVMRHLKAGGVVTLLVDQDAGKSGLRTDFLGRPASTWPGAARISLRTGCPVVAMAIVRKDGGSHELRFGTTLEPDEFRDGPDSVRHYTAAISGAVETFIRERPDQWFWVHRRWKGADEAG